MAITTNKNTDSVPSYIDETELQKAGITNVLNTGTGRVYSITMQMTSGTAPYFKAYDSKSLAYGTTDPVLVFRPVTSSSTPTTIISKSGIPFNTALSIAAGDAGGTGSGGDGDPPNQLDVTIIGD